MIERLFKSAQVNLEQLEDRFNVLRSEDHFGESDERVGCVAFNVPAPFTGENIPLRVNLGVAVNNLAVFAKLSRLRSDLAEAKFKLKVGKLFGDNAVDDVFKSDCVKVNVDAVFSVVLLNVIAGVKLESFAAVYSSLEINVYGDRKDTGGSFNKLADRSDEVGDDRCQTVLAYGVSEVCKDREDIADELIAIGINYAEDSIEDRSERACAGFNGFVILSLSKNILYAESLKERDDSVVIAAAAHDVDFLECADARSVLAGGLEVIGSTCKDELEEEVKRLEKVGDGRHKLSGARNAPVEVTLNSCCLNVCVKDVVVFILKNIAVFVLLRNEGLCKRINLFAVGCLIISINCGNDSGCVNLDFSVGCCSEERCGFCLGCCGCRLGFIGEFILGVELCNLCPSEVVKGNIAFCAFRLASVESVKSGIDI